jgi:SAM-dependent methyltransferase
MTADRPAIDPAALGAAGPLLESLRAQLSGPAWVVGDAGVRRALDVGCGVMGWLRVLAEGIDPAGTIVGIDIDGKMLEAAGAFVQEQQLKQVKLEKDDLFSSRLAPTSFDLTHARFQIAPRLGGTTSNSPLTS